MKSVRSLKGWRITAYLCVFVLLITGIFTGCSHSNEKSGNTGIEKEDKNTKITPTQAATQSPTDTLTPTDTQAPTSTPTPTATQAPTSTPTPTATPTPTDTQAPTAGSDKSGDYIGTVMSPSPPKGSTYRAAGNTMISVNDQTFNATFLVLHIEAIDDGNFSFYFTLASKETLDSEVTENLIFKKHIAHYTEDGYYEFIGNDYHLYFTNKIPRTEPPAWELISVYGLEGLVDQAEYTNGDAPQLNGMSGITLGEGLPYAG